MKIYSKTLFVFFLVYFFNAYSQIASVAMYSGEGALANGFGGSVAINTQNPQQIVFLEFNSTLGQILFLKSFDSGITIGPSGGIHYKTMWFAPFFSYSPCSSVNFTSWNGFMAGKPKEPNWQINFLFSYHAVDLNYKNIKIKYAILHYQFDKPMNMPNITYSIPLTNSDNFDISATYEITNKYPMYLVRWQHEF